jgi:hypothetical protein
MQHADYSVPGLPREDMEVVGFSHPMFRAFFAADFILYSLQLEARASRKVVDMLGLRGRRIQHWQDGHVLHFLAQLWHSSSYAREDARSAVRKSLLDTVAASASCSAPGSFDGAVQPQQLEDAASNAATILAWLGEPMVGQDWANVRLRQADMTRAILCGTSFVGAQLVSCDLRRALLRGVKMTNATLLGSTFSDGVVCVECIETDCAGVAHSVSALAFSCQDASDAGPGWVVSSCQ